MWQAKTFRCIHTYKSYFFKIQYRATKQKKNSRKIDCGMNDLPSKQTAKFSNKQAIALVNINIRVWTYLQMLYF